MEGNEKWKQNKISRLYNYNKVEARYKLMKTMRKNKDIKGLMYSLRQDLQKNLGGIASLELYDKCRLGTKELIEKYHNEIIKCI